MVGIGAISMRDMAYEAWDREDWAAAGALLEEEAKAVFGPGATELWFDAALAYKNLRDWPRALEFGYKAAGFLAHGASEPAWWNLGIAATALGRWDVAREAWSAYGVRVPSGTGEVRMDYGMTPVRLDPKGVGEVVWAHRICPARAIIQSIPMSCDRRFGDVVLHDGKPSGQRIVRGRTFAVLDEIQVLESSEMPTWKVYVNADKTACKRLLSLFATQDYCAEATSNVKPLCTCCSAGNVEQHVVEAANVDQREFWLAAPEETVHSILKSWRDEAPDKRTYARLTPVEDDG